MRIQIIAEGPTDREILNALITKINKWTTIEFIEESKTQIKRRGKNSILLQYSMIISINIQPLIQNGFLLSQFKQ